MMPGMPEEVREGVPDSEEGWRKETAQEVHEGTKRQSL